jgi:hypothetical protein
VANKLTFDWSIELAQIKRMVADARLWNRVVEAQSPLHYFAGETAGCGSLLGSLSISLSVWPFKCDPHLTMLLTQQRPRPYPGFYWQLLFNVERTNTPDVPPPANGAGAGPGAAGGGAGGQAGAGAGAGAAAGNGGGGAGAGGGANAAAGAGGAVIEFVGVRCSATLGLQDAWPRVVRFKANISSLQTGFFEMEYVYAKALEGVIQDGVGLGYPGES